MKKLLLIIFTFLVTFANAQTYNLSVINSAYSNLTGSTSLNNGVIWDNPNYTFPIGFNFQLFTTIFNSASLNANGDGGVVSQTPTATNILPVLIPFGTNIVDRGIANGNGVSLSNISYKLDGVVGNRICKLEWNNVGFFGDFVTNNSTNDFANFQMWLYETSNIIEFRYGPSTINAFIDSFESASGPSVAIFPLVNFNTGVPEPGIVLSGLASAPSTNTTDNQLFLTGMPSNGTIYRFTPSNLIRSDFNFNNEISVYPNPVTDVFTINRNNLNQDTIMVNIFDFSGKYIKKITSNFDKIEISDLKNGMYILEIKSIEKTFYQKIVKN